MKVTELDTKNVQVTRTEKRCILNDKVFELDSCPDWAEWAAVDKNGTTYWHESKPETVGSVWINDDHSRLIVDEVWAGAIVFDSTDWQHSLIRRPQKVLEVTMADLEKKFGCKVKIVKEI